MGDKQEHSVFSGAVPRLAFSTARHKTLIDKLKLLIFTIITILVLSIIIWPLTDYGKKGLTLKFERRGNIGDEPVMIKPRLHGVNDDNQQYNVSAEKAVQLDKKTVELYEVDADIYLKNGQWLNITANKGLYDAQIREVDLNGNVNIFLDNGYEVSTEASKVYLKKGRVEGNKPVTVNSPMGVIKANKFVVYNQMDSVKFIGNVHLKAYPKTLNESQ